MCEALAALHCKFGTHVSHVDVLVDNMSCALAFERWRAKTHSFIIQLRRAAAISLFLNLKISFRWIPSEMNPADQPRREFGDDAGSTVQTNVLFLNKYVMKNHAVFNKELHWQ